MKKTELHGIFPTPVHIGYLNRDFSKQELATFEKYGKDTHKNEGNITSNERYVLEDKSLAVLKTQVLDHVNLYIKNVIQPKNDIEPYITISWLNYTEEGQFHHKHEHPNSFLSGVLYIDSDRDNDKINFFRPYPHYQQIKLNPKEWNLYNAESWWFAVETGMIVLFPSYLTHMVETKAGKNTRTSLAFNTFLKGTIGSGEELTELII